MNLNNKNNISSIVLNILRDGPVKISDLIVKIKEIRKGTTKQGIYKVLSKLLNDEIIVISKKVVSLNILWLDKMYEFFTLAENAYSKVSFAPGQILSLSDGDRIQYSFKTTVFADSFWNHTLLLLNKVIDPSEPLLIYNPHWWFIMGRENSEKILMRKITSYRQFLIAVAGNKPLDKIMFKYFDNNMSQYYLIGKNLFGINNYYVNIMGDILIEVWLNKTVSRAIENIYNQYTSINNEVINKIQNVINMKNRSKIVISKNTKKLKRIKNKLEKFFYIKKIKKINTQ